MPATPKLFVSNPLIPHCGLPGSPPWHRRGTGSVLAPILAKAAKALGNTAALATAEAFVAAESGDDKRAAALFAQLAARDDDTLRIARIRFYLRQGEPEAAQQIALPMLSGRVAGQVWPYLSTIWRLLGDPRAAWLDGDPVYAAQLDVGLTQAELNELAELLRSLHTMQRPYGGAIGTRRHPDRSFGVAAP